MIHALWWLFGQAWWGLPTLAAVVAGGFALLGAWPLLLALIARIPPRLLVLIVSVLAAVIAGSGLYAVGLEHGQERCEAAQDAAEAKADERAKGVGARAQAKAQDASEALTKITEEAADEVRREVRSLPRACPDPVLPDVVHDRLGDAVRRAREALPDDAAADP